MKAFFYEDPRFVYEGEVVEVSIYTDLEGLLEDIPLNSSIDTKEGLPSFLQEKTLTENFIEKLFLFQELVDKMAEHNNPHSWVDFYNEYADINSLEEVFSLNEDTINNLFKKPWDAVNNCAAGFNTADDYFIFNGYDHMMSFNIYELEEYIDLDEAVEHYLNYKTK